MRVAVILPLPEKIEVALLPRKAAKLKSPLSWVRSLKTFDGGGTRKKTVRAASHRVSRCAGCGAGATVRI